jgi:hypothetical protein
VLQLEHPDGGFIALGTDRHQLTATIREHDIGVLILGAKAVRDALQPGRAIARETGAGVLGLMHPRKAGGTFRDIVQGSHAFNAVSRSSLLLAEDPDNDGGRVLVRGKGNLSQAPSAVQFDIVSHKFKAHGRTFNVPLAKNFAHGGNITANDLIAAQHAPKNHTKLVMKGLAQVCAGLGTSWWPRTAGGRRRIWCPHGVQITPPHIEKCRCAAKTGPERQSLVMKGSQVRVRASAWEVPAERQLLVTAASACSARGVRAACTARTTPGAKAAQTLALISMTCAPR